MGDEAERSAEPWLIDFHTHAIDPGLPDLSAGSASVPTVSSLPEDRIQVHFEGRPYRVMDKRAWSPADRLADMDALGVRTQVVSPFPITYCYDIPEDVGTALAQSQNRFLEGFTSHSSGRFEALGAVPLQSPGAAAAELSRCMTELGFVGVAIGTEVAGIRLSDPSLREFWSAADQFNAAVLVHPVDQCVDVRISQARLGFGLGMPTEIAFAGLDLLRAGILEAYPGVRICLSHGGGSLPSVLPRTAFGQSLGLAAAPTDRSVLDSASRLWIDSLTYDADVLGTAARRVGPDHVVFGTDYPGATPADLVNSVLNGTGLGEAFAKGVGADNATRLLSNRTSKIGRGI